MPVRRETSASHAGSAPSSPKPTARRFHTAKSRGWLELGPRRAPRAAEIVAKQLPTTQQQHHRLSQDRSLVQATRRRRRHPTGRAPTVLSFTPSSVFFRALHKPLKHPHHKHQKENNLRTDERLWRTPSRPTNALDARAETSLPLPTCGDSDEFGMNSHGTL